MTRQTSSKLLSNSNFYSGISVDLITNYDPGLPDIIVPLPETVVPQHELLTAIATESDSVKYERLVNSESVSSMRKLIGIYEKVLTFVNNCKKSLKAKNPITYEKLVVLNEESIKDNALQRCVIDAQREYFQDIFNYFDSNSKLRKNLPSLVSQLNVFKDIDEILRVKAKFSKWRNNLKFPILLSKDCDVAIKVIRDAHLKLSHAGIYTVLSEIRKSFWIPKIYSLTKSIINKCVHCRRFNNKAIVINQNSYRDFRTDPSCVPFRSMFVDHCGPFNVILNGKVKAYILILTCLWSRAVNLIVCRDLSVKSFLESLQMHIYSYGVPELIISDMGSQLVSGSKIIKQFLQDTEVDEYFRQHRIKKLEFDHYDKGRNELGSIVEIMVKLTKKMLFGAIRNLTLEYFEFEFFVKQSQHLVNRRPVLFKECLSNSSVDDSVPQAITPEMLLHGFELPSLNIIPGLQTKESADEDWTSEIDKHQNITEKYEKLLKVRNNLNDIYNKEFLFYLSKQATAKKGLYTPKNHEKLELGDLVLIKETLTKLSNLPMAMVTDVKENNLGEVTSVTLKKGKSGEILKRHSSVLIPLLKSEEYRENIENTDVKTPPVNIEDIPIKRPPRKAAQKCKEKLSEYFTS